MQGYPEQKQQHRASHIWGLQNIWHVWDAAQGEEVELGEKQKAVARSYRTWCAKLRGWNLSLEVIT